jgi:hypothetical protein
MSETQDMGQSYALLASEACDGMEAGCLRSMAGTRRAGQEVKG